MNIYMITGTHGFVGGTLIKYLRKQGEAVYPVPRDFLYQIDKLTDAAEAVEPTHIIHCASYGNMYNQQDEKLIIEANMITTCNLLKATKSVDYKSFVYVSSSSVYGKKEKPMSESDILEADTFYGIAKIGAELVIKAFNAQNDKPITIVRPFSLYGEGEADFRFIPLVIHCIKHNLPFKLSPGMHDWVYIRDFLRALILISEIAPKNEIINIGTGQQYDNYEVVKILASFAKRDPEHLPIEFVGSLRPFDYHCWVADNSKLASIGFLPEFSFAEGLKNTFDYYK